MQRRTFSSPLSLSRHLLNRGSKLRACTWNRGTLRRRLRRLRKRLSTTRTILISTTTVDKVSEISLPLIPFTHFTISALYLERLQAGGCELQQVNSLGRPICVQSHSARRCTIQGGPSCEWHDHLQEDPESIPRAKRTTQLLVRAFPSLRPPLTDSPLQW